jgi:hypothetical protein
MSDDVAHEAAAHAAVPYLRITAVPGSVPGVSVEGPIAQQNKDMALKMLMLAYEGILLFHAKAALMNGHEAPRIIPVSRIPDQISRPPGGYATGG